MRAGGSVLHIGIDEAGYGPVLGPFVVGAAVFRLPDEPAPGANLRERLRGIVVKAAAKAGDGALPVHVDDSKLVYTRFGLEGLARGVAAFVNATAEKLPTDLADWLGRHAERAPEHYGGTPWYRDLARARFPETQRTGPLREAFQRRRVEALALRVLPVDAPEWNARLAECRNKATTLGWFTGEVLLRVLDRYPGEETEVVLDRHGGRLDYGAYLGSLFPFARIDPKPSPRGEAHYEVEADGRLLHVRFATSADRISLAVGWASMAAKLTRELFMSRLNAWFSRRLPGVRRTAGYFADGRRFANEVIPVLTRQGIEHGRLVRVR